MKTNVEIDTKVIALQSKVEEKKKNISQAERPAWKTNCVLPLEKGAKNLQTIGTVAECVQIYSSILAAHQCFDAANEDLGTKETFSWGGFKMSDWKADFKTRVAMISVVKEKQKLRELETALESLESSELKKQKVLASIEAALED